MVNIPNGWKIRDPFFFRLERSADGFRAMPTVVVGQTHELLRRQSEQLAGLLVLLNPELVVIDHPYPRVVSILYGYESQNDEDAQVGERWPIRFGVEDREHQREETQDHAERDLRRDFPLAVDLVELETVTAQAIGSLELNQFCVHDSSSLLGPFGAVGCLGTVKATIH